MREWERVIWRIKASALIRAKEKPLAFSNNFPFFLLLLIYNGKNTNAGRVNFICILFFTFPSRVALEWIIKRYFTVLSTKHAAEELTIEHPAQGTVIIYIFSFLETLLSKRVVLLLSCCKVLLRV